MSLAPDAPIPEQLRLPDGREFRTADLRNRMHSHVILQLRAGDRVMAAPRDHQPRYTIEDRVLIADQLTFQQIADRYGLTRDLSIANLIRRFRRELALPTYRYREIDRRRGDFVGSV